MIPSQWNTGKICSELRPQTGAMASDWALHPFVIHVVYSLSLMYMCLSRSQGSSVGITGYVLSGANIFLSVKACWLALGPTQPPFQRMLWVLSLGVQLLGHGRWPPPVGLKLRVSGAVPLQPPYAFRAGTGTTLRLYDKVHYFIWQLLVATSCRLICPINVANSADHLQVWQ